MNMKKFLDFREALSLLFLRDVIAEVVGTFYMMVYVTFSMVTLDEKIYKPSTPLVGLMVGLAIFILIEAFRPISGGHLNPCVSFAAAVMKRISPVRAVCYTLAQCVGSILAGLLVYGLTPEDSRSQIFAFTPNEKLSSAQAVFTEAFLIFNLIFVGLSVSEKKHKEKGSMPGLPTGLGVGLGIMAAGTYTGVCINPIAALGPSTTAKNFTRHWVYWVGGYLGTFGAVMAFLICQKLQSRHEKLTMKGQDSYVEESHVVAGSVAAEDHMHNEPPDSMEEIKF